jgi:acetyltransferase-like isoleucine patch superfamily enzyme
MPIKIPTVASHDLPSKRVKARFPFGDGPIAVPTLEQVCKDEYGVIATVMTYIGRLALLCYRMCRRLKCKCFSVLVSGAFASFGTKTILILPIRVSGERRMALGDRDFVGAGSWLQTLPDGHNDSIAIRIGDGTSIAAGCVISAARSVIVEEDVLIATNVYISDHIHRYTDTDKPIRAQGIDKIRPVLVKRGAWLGQNVVVCSGVTIGKGAVIGANSVVNQNIPDFTVAVGTPARVVKTIECHE